MNRLLPAPVMKLPYRILVLDDDERALASLVEMLRDAGHLVTGATTYDAAKRLLSLSSYDLLIADVKLRGFNGIDLIRQANREWPEMGTVILADAGEPMMDMEAGRYGATLIHKPLQPGVFMQTVASCLGNVRRQRRWPRKRVVGGFRVTADGKPASVVDVCYGGLRIEVPADQALPKTFDVEVAGIGLHIEVEPVWAQPSASGDTVLCGAALSSDATPAARTWRAIVDRLTA